MTSPTSPAPSEALELLCELVYLLRARPQWRSIVSTNPDLSRIVARAASLVDDADRQAMGGAS